MACTLCDVVKCARGRGRPTRTWLTDIAEWTGIWITTFVRETEDRQKWRKIVVSSKFTRSWERLRNDQGPRP